MFFIEAVISATTAIEEEILILSSPLISIISIDPCSLLKAVKDFKE